MRWFAFVVAFCLVAAGVTRTPAPPTLDRHESTLEDATNLASLVPRRTTTYTTDKRTDRRLDLQTVAAVRLARPFARSFSATSFAHSTPAAPPRCCAQSARGPPATSAASSNPYTS
ncbi:MAG: hypothetical protein H0T42_15025 [Deltaproteobacteria bacterium]|nr:hypothetical protein [Deltaproteobacteria bacterium]